jgi:hypothetical protein
MHYSYCIIPPLSEIVCMINIESDLRNVCCLLNFATFVLSYIKVENLSKIFFEFYCGRATACKH